MLQAIALVRSAIHREISREMACRTKMDCRASTCCIPAASKKCRPL